MRRPFEVPDEGSRLTRRCRIPEILLLLFDLSEVLLGAARGQVGHQRRRRRVFSRRSTRRRFTGVHTRGRRQMACRRLLACRRLTAGRGLLAAGRGLWIAGHLLDWFGPHDLEFGDAHAFPFSGHLTQRYK